MDIKKTNEDVYQEIRENLEQSRFTFAIQRGKCTWLTVPLCCTRSSNNKTIYALRIFIAYHYQNKTYLYLVENYFNAEKLSTYN